MKTKKLITTLTIFLLLVSVAAAQTTVQQLIDSYDYSVDDGTFTGTTFSDVMIDTNSNTVVDQLDITFLTPQTSGTYTFLVEFRDSARFVAKETTKTLSSGDTNAVVSIPTELLTDSQFTYTGSIYNDQNLLVYRSTPQQTQVYSNYDLGTSISAISDQAAGNTIQINFQVDSSKTQTVDVSVTLDYGAGSIAKTEQKSLVAGQQAVTITFDPGLIQKSHHNGAFTITKIAVGDKTFTQSVNTQSYNYENFAQDSYIKSVTTSTPDADSDGLYDSLDFNFILEIAQTEFHALTFDLYDGFGNYVATHSVSGTVPQGTYAVSTQSIAGADIYKSRINGPYTITLATLERSVGVVDQVVDFHTTAELFATEFERPPQPDLETAMVLTYNEQSQEMTVDVTLTNTGQAPAFNVLYELFDDTSFEQTKLEDVVDVGESIPYSFTHTSTDGSSVYTAIVDFANSVDESDETNNLAQDTYQATPPASNAKLSELSVLDVTGLQAIVGFTITNEGAQAENVNWQVDTESTQLTSNSPISLQPTEKAWVFVEHSYASAGNYPLTATITDSAGAEAAQTVVDLQQDLEVSSLQVLDASPSKKIFEMVLENFLGSTEQAVSWQLDTDDTVVVNSVSTTDIGSNDKVFVYVEHDYSSSGSYQVTGSLQNSNYLDAEQLQVVI